MREHQDREEYFTNRLRINQSRFDTFVANRPDLAIAKANGNIEVYRIVDRIRYHAGRYLPALGAFWFETADGWQRYMALRDQQMAEDGYAAITPGSLGIAESWPPKCRGCGAVTVARSTMKLGYDKVWFWGCSEFPRCQATYPMTVHPDDRARVADDDPELSPEANKATWRKRAAVARNAEMWQTIKRLEAAQ